MACAATNNAPFRGAIEKGSLSGVISRQGSVIEKIEKGGLKGSNFLEGLKGGNWEQNHINRENKTTAACFAARLSVVLFRASTFDFGRLSFA